MALDRLTHRLRPEIISRPYRDALDLQAMGRLVQAAAGRSRLPLVFLHPGDITWRMFRSLAFDPRAHIHLWETRGGELLGFAWFYSSHNGVDLQIRPGWRRRGVTKRMVRWAEQVARRELPGRGRGQTLRFSCFDNDRQRQKRLTAEGYHPDLFHYVHLRLPLMAAPATPLPAGFRLRATRPEDAGARAALHDAAFYASEVTADSYARLMAAPGYDPELDLVVEGADGRLVAFALCWVDEANGVGLFEPVGTHPDFRRRGLARSLVSEGLRRLQDRRMTAAWVYTESPNRPALQLYTSLGFQVAGRAYDYVKKL